MKVIFSSIAVLISFFVIFMSSADAALEGSVECREISLSPKYVNKLTDFVISETSDIAIKVNNTSQKDVSWIVINLADNRLYYYGKGPAEKKIESNILSLASGHYAFGLYSGHIKMLPHANPYPKKRKGSYSTFWIEKPELHPSFYSGGCTAVATFEAKRSLSTLED